MGLGHLGVPEPCSEEMAQDSLQDRTSVFVIVRAPVEKTCEAHFALRDADKALSHSWSANQAKSPLNWHVLQSHAGPDGALCKARRALTPRHHRCIKTSSGSGSGVTGRAWYLRWRRRFAGRRGTLSTGRGWMRVRCRQHHNVALFVDGNSFSRARSVNDRPRSTDTRQFR